MTLRTLIITLFALLPLNSVSGQELLYSLPGPVLSAAQDDRTGSTMTLEDLRKTKQQKQGQTRTPVLTVQPAAEPVEEAAAEAANDEGGEQAAEAAAE